ncbi:MAG: metallophosphoesterase [Ruminococcus sp.]|nr:metallophosphoesterase [Ruminococcus sp.]
MKKIRLLYILSAIVGLYAWGFALQTVHYNVKSEKTDGLRIVFISDLHNCSYGGKDQSGIIKKIESAQPDLVLFGGDVIDHVNGTENALTLMKYVAGKYPCAYSAGNHESYRDDLQQFYTDVADTGVTVLDDTYTDLEINDCKVRIYGVVNSVYSNITPETPSNYYNILLLHEPQQFVRYTKDFDLILSGHAHGGQWRLPLILEQGFYAPDQGLFPQYTNGQYEYGIDNHIISRGLARPLRMILIPRIFNRPELSVIDIS